MSTTPLHQRIKIKGEQLVILTEDVFKQLVVAASESRVEQEQPSENPLGQRIIKVREKWNLTGHEFSVLIDTTQAQVSRIENGQKPNRKTSSKIENIVRALELNRTEEPG